MNLMGSLGSSSSQSSTVTQTLSPSVSTTANNIGATRPVVITNAPSIWRAAINAAVKVTGKAPSKAPASMVDGSHIGNKNGLGGLLNGSFGDVYSNLGNSVGSAINNVMDYALNVSNNYSYSTQTTTSQISGEGNTSSQSPSVAIPFTTSQGASSGGINWTLVIVAGAIALVAFILFRRK